MAGYSTSCGNCGSHAYLEQALRITLNVISDFVDVEVIKSCAGASPLIFDHLPRDTAVEDNLTHHFEVVVEGAYFDLLGSFFAQWAWAPCRQQVLADRAWIIASG